MIVLISPDEVELQVDAWRVKLPMVDVMLIDFPETKSEVSEEPQVVGLLDGSQINCSVG